MRPPEDSVLLPIFASDHHRPNYSVSRLIGFSFIKDCLNAFDRYQAGTQDAFNGSEETLNLFLGIDDLDHYRKIERQTQNSAGVKVARFTEPHRTPEDSGARQMVFARFQYDYFEQWFPLILVTFTDKDS